MRAHTFAAALALLFCCTTVRNRVHAVDCNANGIEDACDLSCGIAGGVCDLPGCGLGSDCNLDGVPDDCQLVASYSDDSGALSPIGGTAPQSYVVFGPPLAFADVTLAFSARADFGSSGEYIDIAINGTPVGLVFQFSPQCVVTSDELVIPAATFNAAVAGGNAVITMNPTSSVSTTLCNSPFVSVAVSYLGDGDCNSNGLPSDCDIAAGTSADCNTNGIPDECETDCNANGIPDACDLAAGASADCNADAIPDECNIASGVSADCNSNQTPDECELAGGSAADCNANSTPDECDIAAASSIDCQFNGIPDECEDDCNGNGVDDSCDIAGGSSIDCNGNLIPDECEADCNANGTADACDLAAGTSSDCNTNGVPDECDIAGTAGGEVLYGVERDSPALYTIDPLNGVLTLVGDMDQDIGGATGLAIHPTTRELYAVVIDTAPSRGGSQVRRLVRVDRDTAAVEQIGTLTTPIADIAFCSDGMLYGVVGQSGPASAEIVIIDTTDASVTSTGIFGSVGGGQSIACQADADVLYHTYSEPKIGTDIETIELASGDVTFLATLSAFNGYNALTFVPTGEALLTYTFGDLYTVDATTGADALVSSSSTVITGIAFFFSISGDCNTNAIPDECEIAAGSAADCDLNGTPDACDPDCNLNGSPDACDIAGGFSADCNSNGTPDECEVDCNANGTPDDCDVAAGSSLDTNANDVPDECEFIDCNSNGVQDSDDIAGGSSADCNASGIPDECELAPGIAFELLGVERDNALLFNLDLGDASTTVVAGMDQPISGAIGLSVHPQTGVLYAVLQPDAGGRVLATVDRHTASVNIIGPLGDVLSDIAFRSDGRLFGVSGNGGTNSGEIYEIGTSDAALTSTGIVRGNGGGQSIAFQPATDHLFHVFGQSFPGGTLSMIDLNTGGVTIVTDTLTPYNVNAMTFTNHDTLVMSEFGDVYEVDSNTGAAQLRGTGNRTITGLASFAASNGDCNTNGTPDECDLAAGTSQDCNLNAIPDECEIALGLAGDDNGDGVPDACRTPGDCNDDGTINLDDFGQLPACLNGPAGVGLAPACACVDLDGDGDVDLVDFALFQLAFPG